MNKLMLVRQMQKTLHDSARLAEKSSRNSAEEARHGANGKEKRDDARVMLENAGMARGQKRRAAQVRAELSALDGFLPVPLEPGAAITLGALVEIEDEDTEIGRTFFLAPSGAGMELTAPGGDGFFTVVTPHSPVGRACLGKRVGESIEVTVAGDTRYWEITWAG